MHHGRSCLYNDTIFALNVIILLRLINSWGGIKWVVIWWPLVHINFLMLQLSPRLPSGLCHLRNADAVAAARLIVYLLSNSLWNIENKTLHVCRLRPSHTRTHLVGISNRFRLFGSAAHSDDTYSVSPCRGRVTGHPDLNYEYANR